MKIAASSLVAALCLGLLCPVAHGQYYTLDQFEGNEGWEEVEGTNRIDISTVAMVTGSDVREFNGMGLRTYAVMRDDFMEPDTITFGDEFNPPAGFAFALKQIPYGQDMYRELGGEVDDPDRVNADYLVSDLMVVSARANNLDLLNSVDYEVRAHRNRDPSNHLPIPKVAEQKYGKVTYETGERRTKIAVPLTCPAGFEYRMVDVSLRLTRENACRCQAACKIDTASCFFSGSGMYAIAVVPEWLCQVEEGTPAPFNDEDPLDEKAAIAAGVILSVLAMCCCIICFYLCIRMGPPDDHWNHAPRAPGAIPLPPSYKKVEEEEEEIERPQLPKAPPRILPDGNPHPYNITGPKGPGEQKQEQQDTAAPDRQPAGAPDRQPASGPDNNTASNSRPRPPALATPETPTNAPAGGIGGPNRGGGA
mmetsp:Transcript_55067/g.112546  ORF Transcript_55067/g.112546 Transcript_55067/m.112546 type:complete len:421 (-) Transcript_55067:92-1354(-)